MNINGLIPKPILHMMGCEQYQGIIRAAVLKRLQSKVCRVPGIKKVALVRAMVSVCRWITRKFWDANKTLPTKSNQMNE